MNEEVWEKTLSPIYIIIVVFLVMFIFTSWVKGSINPLDWALTDESIGNSDQFEFKEFEDANDKNYQDIGDLKEFLYYIKAETSSKLEKLSVTKGTPSNVFADDSYYTYKTFALNFKEGDDTVGVKQILINFKIPKKELEDNNVNPNWIRIAYFRSGEWQFTKGNPKLSNEEDGFYRYNVGVDYSDSYAIVASK